MDKGSGSKSTATYAGFTPDMTFIGTSDVSCKGPFPTNIRTMMVIVIIMMGDKIIVDIYNVLTLSLAS